MTDESLAAITRRWANDAHALAEAGWEAVETATLTALELEAEAVRLERLARRSAGERGCPEASGELLEFPRL